jgi:cation diffusion facilitator family transporter
VVLTILASAAVAGVQAVERLLHPEPVGYLWAVSAASVVGFLGNEAVALLRIRVGREIGSAALVADGYHARFDGWTSLAVLLGALGVYLGYPSADPLLGLAITGAILIIAWRSAKPVFTRMLDGVESGIIDQVAHAPSHVPGVQKVTGVKARWIGHRIHAEVSIAVDPSLTVAQAHAIAKRVHRQLLDHLPQLSTATIHVDPTDEPGEEYHSPTGGEEYGPVHCHCTA